MAQTIRSGQTGDIPGILALQEQNLVSRLSVAEQADGFVTTPFTPPLLEELLAEAGIVVAEQAGRIVGYILAGSWRYYARWPIFPVMVARFAHWTFQGWHVSEAGSFQYGPICLARELRGSGLLARLFEGMRMAFAPRYPVGVTFINQRNARSLRAHTAKLGLTVVDSFAFGDQAYHTLAFDTRRSVLADADAA